MRLWIGALLGLVLSVMTAQASEQTIRENLTKNFPKISQIDEVRPTPIPEIFEVRVNGSDLIYTDATGRFAMIGELLDTQNKVNLTQKRLHELNAVDFDSFPFKDAFVVVRGNGKNKLVTFEDPNCGYCKFLEHEFEKVDDVTIYVFLYPVLGPSSVEKSHAIWCAKNRAKTWQDWMTKATPIPPAATCDTSAIDRNLAFGKAHRVDGTPTLFLQDGTRIGGALEAAQLNKILSQVK